MSDHDPRGAIRRVTKSMNAYVKKHERPMGLVDETGPAFAPPLSSTAAPSICVVLLKALTKGVLETVPDDFHGLMTAASIKDHVRPDGGVYVGAYELQNHPDSVCLVYGPKDLDPIKAERCATVERPALLSRYDRAKLGVFAAAPSPSLSA